jgi:hypothetical protein
MQTDSPVTVTIPPTSELAKNIGVEAKSLAVGDEIEMTGKVTASDESGITIELASATKPAEGGSLDKEGPEENAEEGGKAAEGDTSKATDFVKKQMSMGA